MLGLRAVSKSKCMKKEVLCSLMMTLAAEAKEAWDIS